jgi:dihydrofolate reductase
MFMLPQVHVYIAVSLDGFIARDNGALDWLEPMQVEGEDYGYADFYGSTDALILGRSTYDSVLAFPQWPFEGKRVVVLTHRALDAKHGEGTHAGALEPLLQALGRDGVAAVYLDGGQAVRQGLREGLVDTLTLNIVPVLLGRGRQLFDAQAPATTWVLAGSRSFATGLVQNKYRRQP